MARGIKLEQLKSDVVRPTTDKVKESAFNIVQFDINGANFLDLFAGSGQMGIEALSRGSNSVVLVDNHKETVSIVKKNLLATNLGDKAKVVLMDAITFLKHTQLNFDIAFLDPPYKAGLLQKVFDLIPNVMSRRGIIICEHPVEETLSENIKNFRKTKSYKYGKIILTVYRGEDF